LRFHRLIRTLYLVPRAPTTPPHPFRRFFAFGVVYSTLPRVLHFPPFTPSTKVPPASFLPLGFYKNLLYFRRVSLVVTSFFFPTVLWPPQLSHDPLAFPFYSFTPASLFFAPHVFVGPVDILSSMSFSALFSPLTYSFLVHLLLVRFLSLEPPLFYRFAPPLFSSPNCSVMLKRGLHFGCFFFFFFFRLLEFCHPEADPPPSPSPRLGGLFF